MNWKNCLSKTGSIKKVTSGQKVMLIKEEKIEVYWTTGLKGKIFEVVEDQSDRIKVKVYIKDIITFNKWEVAEGEPDEPGIIYCTTDKNNFRLIE